MLILMKIVISSQQVGNMIDRANFNIEAFEVRVSSRSSATSISLSLVEYESSKTSANCISGFPRTLVSEDQSRGKCILSPLPHS